MKKKSLIAALITVIGLRIVSSLLMAAFSWLFPLPDCADFSCSELTQQTLYQQSDYSRLFLSPWYRWDSIHYLDIAENGYSSENTENSVWPLLYPFLIRSLSGVMPPMQVALLLSTFSLFFPFIFCMIMSAGFGIKHLPTVCCC